MFPSHQYSYECLRNRCLPVSRQEIWFGAMFRDAFVIRKGEPSSGIVTSQQYPYRNQDFKPIGSGWDDNGDRCFEILRD